MRARLGSRLTGCKAKFFRPQFFDVRNSLDMHVKYVLHARIVRGRRVRHVRRVLQSGQRYIVVTRVLLSTMQIRRRIKRISNKQQSRMGHRELSSELRRDLFCAIKDCMRPKQSVTPEPIWHPHRLVEELESFLVQHRPAQEAQTREAAGRAQNDPPQGVMFAQEQFNAAGPNRLGTASRTAAFGQVLGVPLTLLGSPACSSFWTRERPKNLKSELLLFPRRIAEFEWTCPECKTVLSASTKASVIGMKHYHWRTRHPECPKQQFCLPPPDVYDTSEDIPVGQQAWKCRLCPAALGTLPRQDRLRAIRKHVAEKHPEEIVLSLTHKSRRGKKKPVTHRPDRPRCRGGGRTWAGTMEIMKKN